MRRWKMPECHLNAPISKDCTGFVLGTNSSVCLFRHGGGSRRFTVANGACAPASFFCRGASGAGARESGLSESVKQCEPEVRVAPGSVARTQTAELRRRFDRHSTGSFNGRMIPCIARRTFALRFMQSASQHELGRVYKKGYYNRVLGCPFVHIAA
jgi:hypothetical protein